MALVVLRFVFVMVAAAVGVYYLWAVRATGNKFYWGYYLGGYYDYLGRAFAHGQLHVPIAPSPKPAELRRSPQSSRDFSIDAPGVGRV